MKILAAVGMLIALTLPVLAWSDVTCPLHNYASCYNTGRVAPSGAHMYHCSCGDDVWVSE